MDKNQKISLIGYECGKGAQKHGCKTGVSFLKSLNIQDKISNDKSKINLYSDTTQSDKLSDFESVLEHNINLVKNLEQCLKANNFPITIGGDHSMAIGTWSAVTNLLNCRKDLGLIWFDAHMDSHTPQTSPSGAYHGMPLACLLGFGDEKFVNLVYKGAKFNPKNICLIGVRSYEKEEKELLDKLGVKVFYIGDIKKLGIKTVFEHALKIATKNTNGFGVSIDIDSMDPKDAPGAGSLEKNGIKSKDIIHLLGNLANNSKLRALEIAEYNPELDKNNITGNLIIKLIKNFLKNR